MNPLSAFIHGICQPAAKAHVDFIQHILKDRFKHRYFGKYLQYFLSISLKIDSVIRSSVVSADLGVARKVQEGKIMIDPEVARLRQLRVIALRVRAIARTLSSKSYALNDSLLGRGARASWRIARAVSGRLKAHPYASYQQDAGFGQQLCDELFASFVALGIRSRERALAEYESHLGALARQLADVRVMTWSPDLGASLGRSQIEIKALLEALARETLSTSDPMPVPHGYAVAANGAGNFASSIEGDWPYLAF
jgi:hypothetical protein